MRIIHIDTQIATTFALVDDEDNVVQTLPITDADGKPATIKFGRLSADNFNAAYEQIVTFRERLVAQLAEQEAAKAREEALRQHVDKRIEEVTAEARVLDIPSDRIIRGVSPIPSKI